MQVSIDKVVMSNRSSFPRRLLLGVAVALLGCGDNGVTQPGSATPALTTLPRELTSAERNVLGASNAFSFGLWKRVNLAQKDSNVFVSPLSASFSLGMAMNGAANQTLDDIFILQSGKFFFC